MFFTPLATTFPSWPRGENLRSRAEELPAFAAEFPPGRLTLVPIVLLILLLLLVWWRPRKTMWVLSVTCFVLLAATWIRSHWRFDRVFISHVQYLEMTVSGGQAYVTWSDDGPPEERVSLRWWSRPQGSTPSIPSGRIVYAGWRQLGFGAGRESSFYGGVPAVFRRVVVPIWFPICLALAWPTYRLATRMSRRNRLRRGCCPTCGYDLRATPGGCPECGAVASGGGPAAASIPGPLTGDKSPTA
jgi:hypothetical protein